MKLMTSNKATFVIVALTSLAAIAQIVDPIQASKLTTQTWREHGLAGILTLALVMMIGLLGFIMQRYIRMLEKTVSALVNISNSHKSLVDTIRGMPCILRRHDVAKEKTPDPFEGFTPIDPSLETPTK